VLDTNRSLAGGVGKGGVARDAGALGGRVQRAANWAAK